MPFWAFIAGGQQRHTTYVASRATWCLPKWGTSAGQSWAGWNTFTLLYGSCQPSRLKDFWKGRKV